MATIDSSLYGSITDIAKRLDPAGNIAPLIEVVAQDNAFVDDMVFTATNDLTTNKTVRRTALPAVHRRRVNQGIPTSKDGTQEVFDRCTHIEGRSQIDTALEETYGARFMQYRDQQDKAYAISMNQRLNYDMFYATTVSDPEDMSGLAQRYSDPTGEWGGQLINGGASSGTDSMSIWLVGHGPGGVVGLYPKNSQAGFKTEDKGVQRIQDDNGRAYYAWETLFWWHYGLAVEDPRGVVRCPNVKDSTLEKAVSSGADILSLMTDMLQVAMRPGVAPLKWVYYMPRKIHNYLYHQSLNKASVELTLEESQTGGKVERFKNPVWLGYPCKIVDQLIANETPIAFS